MSLTLKEKMELQKAEQEKALEHPPIAPTPKISPKPEKTKPTKTIPQSKKKPPTRAIPEIEPLEEEFLIDFNKIANNSSFQRFIIETIKMSVPQLKGVDPRLSKKAVQKAYNQKIKEIDKAVVMYNELKGMDTALLKEVRANALFLSQKRRNNPTQLDKLNKPK